MMRKRISIRKYIISYLLILFLFSWLSGEISAAALASSYNAAAVQAANVEQYSVGGDYAITGYHIDMTVRENNTFDMKETIIANFNVPKHGIFRKLPLSNSVTRLDGSKSRNRAEISNITVSEQYSTYRENGYEVIKIGNEGTTLTGEHSYTIGYTYNIGKDPLKDADELYYNLIGNEWDASISNVTFSIHMPKEFDAELLGFSSGYEGSSDSSKVTYAVDGTTINGSFTDTLLAGQALTLRLTLPEGYFINAGAGFNFYSVFVMVISIIFVLIAGLLWARYGKDDEVIETVEFYPPDGLNSAEVGFIYDGTARSEGVISLLVYLADKGYLSIQETEKKVLFSTKKEFMLTKQKEYNGDNLCEQLFFEGLFKSGDVVTESNLYNKFYITLNRIQKELNSKENKRKIFEGSASGKKIWLILMMLAIYVLNTCKPVLDYSEADMLLPALIFPGLGLGIMLLVLMNRNNITLKVFVMIWGLGFAGVPWALIVFPTLLPDTMYMVMYIVGAICALALAFFLKIMPKRTPYGNEMLGKIKGFKRFLETAHKQQLESLVEQNPEYFYNILPYTYALGISDVWMERFETIALTAPHWYVGGGAFTVHEFNRFMNSTMSSAQSAMSSSPSGSGGSGGGSSGGGSGGGGGGSW